MNRLLFLVAFLLVGGLQLTLAQPAAAQAPSCQFFAETGGFNVCNDVSAQFLTAFNRYGLQRVGYPISRRYERDGFVTQAFQKAIFQWRPDGNYVAFVNVFDELHNMGFDQRLLDTRQTPMPVQNFDPPGATFEQIVQARQALLNARPAIRTAYFSVSDPLLFYGLPTSQVQDMGNHYAIRLQRAVLQEWKEAVPWAAAGQVTVANGADIAKELGALPAAALAPEGSGSGTVVSVYDLEVGDCFDDPPNVGSILELTLIPCNQPHDNEVFAVFDFPAGPSDPFPGEDAINDYADEVCTRDFEIYVGIPYAQSVLYYFTIIPTAETWGAGDREIVCALYDGDFAKLVGSMRGARR